MGLYDRLSYLDALAVQNGTKHLSYLEERSLREGWLLGGAPDVIEPHGLSYSTWSDDGSAPRSNGFGPNQKPLKVDPQSEGAPDQVELYVAALEYDKAVRLAMGLGAVGFDGSVSADERQLAQDLGMQYHVEPS